MIIVSIIIIIVINIHMEFVHFLGTLLLGANYLGPVLESGFGVWER